MADLGQTLAELGRHAEWGQPRPKLGRKRWSTLGRISAPETNDRQVLAHSPDISGQRQTRQDRWGVFSGRVASKLAVTFGYFLLSSRNGVFEDAVMINVWKWGSQNSTGTRLTEAGIGRTPVPPGRRDVAKPCFRCQVVPVAPICIQIQVFAQPFPAEFVGDTPFNFGPKLLSLCFSSPPARCGSIPKPGGQDMRKQLPWCRTASQPACCNSGCTHPLTHRGRQPKLCGQKRLGGRRRQPELGRHRLGKSGGPALLGTRRRGVGNLGPNSQGGGSPEVWPDSASQSSELHGNRCNRHLSTLRM